MTTHVKYRLRESVRQWLMQQNRDSKIYQLHIDPKTGCAELNTDDILGIDRDQ